MFSCKKCNSVNNVVHDLSFIGECINLLSFYHSGLGV